MKGDSIPRLKDVLFALGAAGEVNQPLGRLPLQKVIYLAEVLAPVWHQVSRPSGFSPYKNGPYDSRIQNTVDALVFRGFVTASNASFRRLHNVECQYSLSEEGETLLRRIVANPGLRDDLELFKEISREISRRGWQQIKVLVYSEPTYDCARLNGDSGKLPTGSPTLNLSREILRDLRESLRALDGSPVSRRNLIQMFFEVLVQHAQYRRQIDEQEDQGE
jgi:uncharacterized protein YwgA